MIMKRTLYIECYSGISGDMTVAAMLDLGADQEALKEAINSIRPLVSGFEIAIKKVQKAGICACDFAVILDKEHENHDHDMEYLHGQIGIEKEHHHENGEHHHKHKEHHHEHGEHHHTGLKEITDVLNQAKMTEGARDLARNIFQILAEAESRAHNQPVNEVHFHEVGAVDSIVDILSVAVCMDSLREKYNITDVAISELYEGRGSVRCQHGILPIPVPATANIMEAYQLPVHFMEFQGEFVTPTGAAIAAAVRTKAHLPSKFQIIASGVGAGKRTYEKVSLLRAMILEEDFEEQDKVYKLETNVDDCSGEAFGYVMDRLFEAGARDVYYVPVLMKKNRPAYQLSVICKEEDITKLEQIIFQETTTIGIRRVAMERTVLKREHQIMDTSLGKIAVKVCGKRIYPEYESLVSICQEKEISYLEAYNKIYGELNDLLISNRSYKNV